MSMSARVRTDALGNLTVIMEGGLDFENSLPLRSELEIIMQENPSSEIIIDLNALDFVGSSGIGHFVETLRYLEEKSEIKLSNVKSEFLKVFKLYGYDAYARSIEQAFEEDDNTEFLGQQFLGKKNTFQN